MTMSKEWAELVPCLSQMFWKLSEELTSIYSYLQKGKVTVKYLTLNTHFLFLSLLPDEENRDWCFLLSYLWGCFLCIHSLSECLLWKKKKTTLLKYKKNKKIIVHSFSAFESPFLSLLLLLKWGSKKMEQQLEYEREESILEWYFILIISFLPWKTLYLQEKQ